MNFFGIFGKKAPTSVTAHILDPKTGYSTQIWTVGEQIPREAEDFSEDGHVFITVSYEAGTPEQMICKRAVWNQIKAGFDSLDRDSQARMGRIMDELNKVK